MSQTLYIENNEEVTSIIDRIKNINDKEVVLIIPKKATILQSIVNLKILKKQLDRLNINAVIVTSDKLGRNIAARADFIVKQKLEDENKKDQPFENHGHVPKQELVNPNTKIFGVGVKLRVSDIIRKADDNIFNDAVSQESESVKNTESADASESSTNKKTIGKMNLFINEPSTAKKVILLPNAGKKLFFALMVLTLLVVAVVLFLILPTATITMEPKTELITQEIDAIVDKSTNEVNKDELKIPGQLIEVSKDITKEFSATGTKQVKEKAAGTLTVYNEWDSQSQTLVENTRFTSEDGKIFRSTKTVVVPGFKRSSGQDIAGSTTVLVVADEPGESYNIKSGRFSIPGLKGTVKYEKIYGVSTDSMAGGRIADITVVSDDDLNKAKKSIEKGLRDEIINEVKSKSVDGALVIDNAIFINKENFTSTKKIGEETKIFSLTLKQSGSALAFNEKNIVDLAKQTIEAPFDKYSVAGEPKLTYGESELDLKQRKMSLKVYSETMVASQIDGGKIFENVQGKSLADLQSYFKNVNEVQNVNVRFWPFWVKSIPRINSKVNIDIK